MKQVFVIGAALLLTFTAQASTKIFFNPQGNFIVRDSNNRSVVTKQDYTIQTVDTGIYSETGSNAKAFGLWKNCYESKHESVEFPIPWPQTTYQPFTEVYDVKFPLEIDNNEKTITVDEVRMADFIAQSVSSLNRKTAGMCKIKSIIHARVYVQAADGSKDSFLLTFAVKNGSLLVRYTDIKIVDAYNIDATKEVTISLPNYGAPIPVFGHKL